MGDWKYIKDLILLYYMINLTIITHLVWYTYIHTYVRTHIYYATMRTILCGKVYILHIHLNDSYINHMLDLPPAGVHIYPFGYIYLNHPPPQQVVLTMVYRMYTLYPTVLHVHELYFMISNRLGVHSITSKGIMCPNWISLLIYIHTVCMEIYI